MTVRWEVSPRLERLAIPASVRSLIFCASTFAKDEGKGCQSVVPSHRVLCLGTFGTCLIEPKTPFYSRFEVFALVLLGRP
jgi:hypothetical protein